MVCWGDIRYEGSKYAQVHNFAETGGRTTVGAQAGYRTDRWEIVVWGKNLTDDDAAMDILRYVDSRGYTSVVGHLVRWWVLATQLQTAAHFSLSLPATLVAAPSFSALESPCRGVDSGATLQFKF